MNNKEANSNRSINDNNNDNIDTSNIEYDIHYVLENVAALARDAYGAYNDKMNQLLVLTIEKAIREERIKAQQEIKSAITEATELLEEYTEQDRWQSGDKVIRVINILRNVQK